MVDDITQAWPTYCEDLVFAREKEVELTRSQSSTMEDLRLRAVGRSLTIAAGSLLGLLMIEEKRNFPIFKYIYEPA